MLTQASLALQQASNTHVHVCMSSSCNCKYVLVLLQYEIHPPRLKSASSGDMVQPISNAKLNDQLSIKINKRKQARKTRQEPN